MALERFATYVSGSGTAEWTLEYRIQLSDDVYPVEVANVFALFSPTTTKLVSMTRPYLVTSLRLPFPGRAILAKLVSRFSGPTATQS